MKNYSKVSVPAGEARVELHVEEGTVIDILDLMLKERRNNQEIEKNGNDCYYNAVSDDLVLRLLRLFHPYSSFFFYYIFFQHVEYEIAVHNKILL